MNLLALLRARVHTEATPPMYSLQKNALTLLCDVYERVFEPRISVYVRIHLSSLDSA